jgi:hypothetical protein
MGDILRHYQINVPYLQGLIITALMNMTMKTFTPGNLDIWVDREILNINVDCFYFRLIELPKNIFFQG